MKIQEAKGTLSPSCLPPPLIISLLYPLQMARELDPQRNSSFKTRDFIQNSSWSIKDCCSSSFSQNLERKDRPDWIPSYSPRSMFVIAIELFPSLALFILGPAQLISIVSLEQPLLVALVLYFLKKSSLGVVFGLNPGQLFLGPLDLHVDCEEVLFEFLVVPEKTLSQIGILDEVELLGENIGIRLVQLLHLHLLVEFWLGLKWLTNDFGVLIVVLVEEFPAN